MSESIRHGMETAPRDNETWQRRGGANTETLPVWGGSLAMVAG
jgi:hypothetical protein